MTTDPFDNWDTEEAAGPKPFFGQQTGCLVAAAVAVVGMVAIGLFFVIFYFLVRGPGG